MKRNLNPCFLLMAFVMIIAVGCSKDDDDPGGSIENLLSFFSNSYEELVNGVPNNIRFLLNATDIDSTKGSGKISAREVDTDYELAGGFNRLEVELSYLTDEQRGEDNGPRAGRTYKGKLDTLAQPNALIRMVNTGNAGDSLVLRKEG
ncbi:hypothetical protein [Chitinophaga japonensis]|uniref:Uncharacterized protein n=1 Tax=Chitinophaga japonensis TaxID=104662 RepID=A0A562T6L6_CHIJA|nr:hypothetical protein [Chitinophaga japonensis]TWI89165.1 hypothetical protein LX66_3259 [Chitinophaga japonensis]